MFTATLTWWSISSESSSDSEPDGNTSTSGMREVTRALLVEEVGGSSSGGVSPGAGDPSSKSCFLVESAGGGDLRDRDERESQDSVRKHVNIIQ